MTWYSVIMLLSIIFCLIKGARILLAIISFALHALALYVFFVVAALLTAFLCVGSGQHGEFVMAVMAGLTGGQ